MAQFIEVSATSFGNAHSDDPTYAFSVGTGDIFLSGSGGFVNTPTGITKATLTSGVKLKVTDDSISAVTCSVENGFTCAGEFEYASWVAPSVSPTPSTTVTPSPTPAPTGNTFGIIANYQLDVPLSPGTAQFIFDGGSGEAPEAKKLADGLTGQNTIAGNSYNFSGRPSTVKIYRHTYPYDQADGGTISVGSSAQVSWADTGGGTYTVTITDTASTPSIAEAEDIWIWAIT